MKSRTNIIITALMLIAAAGLTVRAYYRTTDNQQEVVKTEDAKITIFNNTIDNRWVNVPIEIKSLGGYNYRVTNKTDMGIKRFIIALYAATVGKPAHGAGAQRHMVQIRVDDKPLTPGKSVDLNIEERLKEFSSSAHQHADLSRMEMILYHVGFADETGGKQWMGGKYLTRTWEEDPDLNPKEHKNVVRASLSTQDCFVYSTPVLRYCTQCDTGDPICDTAFCRKPILNIVRFTQGVGLAPTCYRCTLLLADGSCDLYTTQCAHGDGSPCAVLVDDLDYNNPC